MAEDRERYKQYAAECVRIAQQTTDPAQKARLLEMAEAWQRLPDDYVDVTQGWFARAKHWVKKTLLNNFKRAYVDVLSRQQSGRY